MDCFMSCSANLSRAVRVAENARQLDSAMSWETGPVDLFVISPPFPSAVCSSKKI